MDATVVSLRTLIIPIVALALGWAFLNERVRFTAVAGISTILVGVAVTIVPGKAGEGHTRQRRHLRLTDR